LSHIGALPHRSGRCHDRATGDDTRRLRDESGAVSLLSIEPSRRARSLRRSPRNGRCLDPRLTDRSIDPGHWRLGDRSTSRSHRARSCAPSPRFGTRAGS